jgi:hypothetical protein
VSDTVRLREQAKRCIRLAQSIDDPATVGVLMEMAGEIEQKATELERTIAPERGPVHTDHPSDPP